MNEKMKKEFDYLYDMTLTQKGYLLSKDTIGKLIDKFISQAIETERDRIIDIVDRVFSLNNKLDKKQWETIKQNFFND